MNIYCIILEHVVRLILSCFKFCVDHFLLLKEKLCFALILIDKDRYW